MLTCDSEAGLDEPDRERRAPTRGQLRIGIVSRLTKLSVHSLHSRCLWRGARQARALFEDAIERVAAREGIALDDPDGRRQARPGG